MFETGHFATLWKKMAESLGLKPEFLGLPGIEGWRRGVQPQMIEARLRADTQHAIKAVCVVHNETSTGVTSDIAAVRRAIDAAGHPALLLVDTISGLACADYRHDEWGVDVTVSGSQKGLMLPPGISFNAVSPKAIAASKQAKLPRSFWDWTEIIEMNKQRLLAVHAEHEPAVRAFRSARHDPRAKGSTTCSRATSVSPKHAAAR